MATHSCILAWRTPGTEEPGRLQSMGSKSQTRLKQMSVAGGPVVKNPLSHAKVTGSIPGLGGSHLPRSS